VLARYCPNCGTEVDETAVFCPTCGQPIDEATETQIPAAPAWPASPERTHEDAPAEPVAPVRPPPPPPEPELEPEPEREPQVAFRDQEPPLPPPAAVPTAAPPPAPGSSPSRSAPVTVPLMLSGWLIGGGAALGALGALIGLFGGRINPIDLLLLLALVGIAASVFGAGSLPTFAHLRLATLAVAFVGFGMALDRIGFGRAGAGDLLLFLGTAAAGIGAILVEVGQDQPLGGPQP
jgi:zinc-ribbon domain